MVRSSLLAVALAAALACAQCPVVDRHRLDARADDGADGSSRGHVGQFDVDDSQGYLTSDVGGRIQDQNNLKAGQRGSTILEDFIFARRSPASTTSVSSREPSTPAAPSPATTTLATSPLPRF